MHQRSSVRRRRPPQRLLFLLLKSHPSPKPTQTSPPPPIQPPPIFFSLHHSRLTTAPALIQSSLLQSIGVPEFLQLSTIHQYACPICTALSFRIHFAKVSSQPFVFVQAHALNSFQGGCCLQPAAVEAVTKQGWMSAEPAETRWRVKRSVRRGRMEGSERRIVVVGS